MTKVLNFGENMGFMVFLSIFKVCLKFLLKLFAGKGREIEGPPLPSLNVFGSFPKYVFLQYKSFD